jgi:SAM-dependent methyltransferase
MSSASRDIIFSGTGPGGQTQDGCSVEVYRRARYACEIEHLRSMLPAGTTVLELGCGTGLLTHRLLDFGCEVTGVDNSAEMLKHVSDRVRKVHADIEQLALEERFDVVLLPSGLINHADAAVRRAFVAAAARHVAPDGVLILKCQNAQWLRTAVTGQLVKSDGVSIELVQVDRTPHTQEPQEPQVPQVRMTLKYTLGEDVWTHAFVVVPMDEPAIAQLLNEAGFAVPEALDAKREWFLAGLNARDRRDRRPCPPSPASPR